MCGDVEEALMGHSGYNTGGATEQLDRRLHLRRYKLKAAIRAETHQRRLHRTRPPFFTRVMQNIQRRAHDFGFGCATATGSNHTRARHGMVV